MKQLTRALVALTLFSCRGSYDNPEGTTDGPGGESGTEEDGSGSESMVSEVSSDDDTSGGPLDLPGEGDGDGDAEAETGDGDGDGDGDCTAEIYDPCDECCQCSPEGLCTISCVFSSNCVIEGYPEAYCANQICQPGGD